MSKKIGVIVGSIRKEAFSKKVAEELKAVAPESLELENVEIGQLEMFNQDYDDEGNTPESWKAFREELKQYDGFIFVTPEHNRSFPAAIKNALDIGSRPYGSNVWDGKPGAVVSVSPSSMGGFGSNHQLRQVLVFLNIPVMQQPEAYIRDVAGAIQENGQFNEGMSNMLKEFMAAYEEWVNRF